jgi:dTDP-4-dehydrorhamnose reductase
MSPEDLKARGRFAVIGAAGQLGFDQARTCTLAGQVVPLTRADIDILDADKARRVLTDLQPTHILNTAAWNEVDRAEDEREPVFALNARAPGDLAAIAQDLGAVFAHFSTDYVFDGRRTVPYAEDDAPNPISVYAESKLVGERRARERCERAFVFRVCGLFGVNQGSGKSNFVRTMLRLARAGRPIRVVSDQVLTPSSTLDLASKVWAVLAAGSPDLYHLTNAGQTSWYDFAREVFRLSGLAPDLQPVTAAEYGARARRPAYSVLAHTRLATRGLDDLRSWRDALAAYVGALARADEAVRPAPSA